MGAKIKRGLWVVGWLGMTCLVSHLSAKEPSLRANLRGHTNIVFSVAFNPDGRTLASGSGGPGWGEIKLWDVATGKEQATLQGHTRSVFSVAFSPDGKTLASRDFDHTIKLWHLATRK